MTRACLFDLGNVVVDWQPSRLYNRLLGDAGTASRFLSDVCTMEWHTAHDRGVPMDDNIAALTALHPHHASAIAAWKTGWLDMFGGYVPGMAVLLARLEDARVPLYALSNMPAEKMAETAAAFPLLRIFRDTVVSGVEGIVKPDPRIYEIALQRMGLDAGDVFFTDDREENVIAARRIGMVGHVFSGAAGLICALESAGISLPPIG